MNENKLYTFPNIMTGLRIVAVCFMVGFYYLPFDWSRYVAAGIFVVAAATDWIDGYLARRYNLVSKLGEVLDPAADKLLVCVALILMVHAYGSFWMVLIAMIISGREIMVMAMRSWLAEERSSMMPFELKVSWLGKLKTFMQYLGIACFFAFPPDSGYALGGFALEWVTLGVLSVATVLTLWSGYYHALAIFRYVTATQANELPESPSES